MDVSKNNGTPKIINFNRVFHYKPSILGYPGTPILETPLSPQNHSQTTKAELLQSAPEPATTLLVCAQVPQWKDMFCRNDSSLRFAVAVTIQYNQNNCTMCKPSKTQLYNYAIFLNHGQTLSFRCPACLLRMVHKYFGGERNQYL